MATLLTPMIDVRRSPDRFLTKIDWLDSRHCFSFGPHYDPKNTHFGLLLVSNHDVIEPDTGFSTHPHRDMEIVTWVLEGELEHKDSEGHVGLIHPGLAQRMSAGTGIWHSEMNATKGGPVELVQMWVVPDTEKIRPSYMELDINSQLDKGGLVPVASGQGHDAAISIRQKHAVLLAGRLKPNETIALPDAPFVHFYVARGDVEMEGAGHMEGGDAARIQASPGLKVTAGPAGAEVLAWEMDAYIDAG